MSRMLVTFGLLVAVCLLLAGCVQLASEVEQGGIRITIPPRGSLTMAASPKMIPANAEFVRVRVFTHPADPRKFNMLVTIPLVSSGSTTDISVPVGTGYCIDAISYLESGGEKYALTWDRADHISISANMVTPVALDLQPWTYAIAGVHPVSATGDEAGGMTVASGAEYSVYVTISGGLGSTNYALMYTSLTSFQDPTTPFPGEGIQWDSVQGYGFWEFRDNPAPSIAYTDEPTPLYVALVFKTGTAEWSDSDNPDRITLCIPNRYLGDPLHQIMVTPPPPPEGSVDLVIQ